MRYLLIAGVVALAACNGGESREATKVTDTTVVQKKVDVSVDTLKKTHNKTR